jgi:enoyl-CoA hydratase/carnithine racemase
LSVRYSEIIYRKRNGLAEIKLNRPRNLNALTKKMVLEIHEAFTDAQRDEEVRVIILTGEGRAFCAGEDLKEGLIEITAQDFRRKILDYQRVTRDIKETAKPVICEVNGFALGGGCEIALSCDIVVASKSAKFGFPEVKVGLLMTNGGFHTLPRLIGEKRAKELALTGDMIDASEAERIGLVNRVVPGEKLSEAVIEIAEKIAQNAPVSVKLTKLLIDRGLDSNFDSVMALETEAVTVTYATEDRQEGSRPFADKRKPHFKGK